jgi:hypothetical protein
MPNRREFFQLISNGTVTLILPEVFSIAPEMKNKLIPFVPKKRQAKFNNIDYKVYLVLAAKKAHEFFDLHKLELFQYGLIVLALAIILGVGLIPTKELIILIM